MLQGDHGPVAYRNIRLAPAGANPFLVLDNGVIDESIRRRKPKPRCSRKLGYAGNHVGLDNCPSLTELRANWTGATFALFTVYAGINIDPEQSRTAPH
jgi:hypothetical protein